MKLSKNRLIWTLAQVTTGIIGGLISATNITTAIPIAGAISIGGLVSIIAWRSLQSHI